MTDTDPRRHAARAALYAAVAEAFCYPDADAVDALRDPDARDGLRSAADRLDLREEVDALLNAVGAADPDGLASAYDQLFGVPGEDGTYPVLPYEAEYTTDDDVGQTQRRVAAVVGLLDELGLEPADDFDERPDHIAAELELAQVLAGQRAVATERGDGAAVERICDVEAALLDAHLGPFVPAFAHDLRAATDNPVYRAAAALAERLVERDRDAHPAGDVLPAPERPREVNADAGT